MSVTATSVGDPGKSVSATFPIVARVPNPLLRDGNYVYQLYGGDKPVVVGTFVAAGGYIVGGEQDYPSSLQELTISPGTVSIPDQYGRVVIDLVSYVPNTTAGVSAYLVGYTIDGVHLPLLETSNYYMVTDNYPYRGATAAINGTAIAQGAATGKFTPNSLASSSYVFGVPAMSFRLAICLSTRPSSLEL